MYYYIIFICYKTHLNSFISYNYDRDYKIGKDNEKTIKKKYQLQRKKIGIKQ